MSEFENAVAEVAGAMTEQPADDAQAAEITAEEVISSLMDGETAENEGDGGPAGQEKQEADAQQEKDDKFSRRMKAALASQKRQFYADLGGSEEEIRQILREHRAAKLSQENPKISP